MAGPTENNVAWIMRKPRSLGNFSIETSYRTMHSAWPSEHPKPDIQVASRFTVGLVNRWNIWREVRSLRHSVIHITGDIHFTAIRLNHRRAILTVHDLGLLDEGGRIKRWLKKKFWLDLPLKSCDRLVAVSNRTKEDILSRTSFPADRITVIPSVISPTYRRREKLPENDLPRILHIGLADNKNLDRHAAALSGLRVHLRIIGEPSAQQHTMLRQLKVDYSTASKLTESELQNEYASSDALLFCSTLEGFGMPIIEAQTIGLPVITSAIAPMDDTAGEGALLVDPTDISAIRGAAMTLLNRPEERDELIEKGHRNAERFSAVTAARRHAELYAELNATQHK
ncbi:MAG TPA: hypothetical protein DHV07_07605 [Flavobacteriales bacterium]|jgi:glycosyltransferase involved in cell wall biosynthesis|nr:hypothetical protein [Flavobacteriales bacterium]